MRWLPALRVIASARSHGALAQLTAQAARLWPESPRNQREWIRAVCVVRATRGGWLLDTNQPRRSK